MTHEKISGESVFELRRSLYSCIRKGVYGDQVLNLLIPNESPLLYEKVLWDYKVTLPKLPTVGNPNKTILDNYNAAMAEIIKDAVSFYNSYGGYIVVGVTDNPREIKGYSEQFDVDDLNKRIKAATGHDVDCHFGLFDFKTKEKNYKLGVLFFPQRSDELLPAQFKRNAPDNPKGKKAYKLEDYYFRQSDECKPAVTPEEISFLCTHGRRRVRPSKEFELQSDLDNNFGPKDPELIQFVGREDHLQSLWQWLLEKYSPCKLLSGLGGVGKTTIARKFAEDIVHESPLGFEKLIWLSAKQKYWRSYSGKTEKAIQSDVSYTDTSTLLRSLLAELGALESEFEEEATLDELLEASVKHLKILPSFVVIDDLDSLEEDEQHTAFQIINQLFSQTLSSGVQSSKALITARLDLGAAPAQLNRIRGLAYDDFIDFLNISAREFDIDTSIFKVKKLCKAFHKVTDGSPVFANSILRLVLYGERLDSAIERWRGSDGEEVRKFAFERELSFLSDFELRTLLVLSVLERAPLIELQHILETNRTRITDNLAALRKYHLVVRDDESPAGGPEITVPNSIRLMQSIIENRISDSNIIKHRCKESRSASAKKDGLEIGSLISRVVGLWKEGNNIEALETVEWADKKVNKNPDIKCLLASAYYNVDEGRENYRKSDAAFRDAFNLKCRKPELFSNWLRTKKELEDWKGIVEVTRLSDKIKITGNNLSNRISAIGKLASEATKRGDYRAAADYYYAGAKEIKEYLEENFEKKLFNDFLDMKYDFSKSYLESTYILNRDPNDYLYTWQAHIKVFDLHVRHQNIIYSGIKVLKAWWSTVENRDRYDLKSSKMLDSQIVALNDMTTILFRKGRQQDSIYTELLKARDYLVERNDLYRSQLT